MNLALFARPGVHSHRKISELTHRFSLICCMKLDNPEMNPLSASVALNTGT